MNVEQKLDQVTTWPVEQWGTLLLGLDDGDLRRFGAGLDELIHDPRSPVGTGFFSLCVRVAASERQHYGTDPLELLRSLQAGVAQFAAAEEPGAPFDYLATRIVALRPGARNAE